MRHLCRVMVSEGLHVHTADKALGIYAQATTEGQPNAWGNGSYPARTAIRVEVVVCDAR